MSYLVRLCLFSAFLTAGLFPVSAAFSDDDASADDEAAASDEAVAEEVTELGIGDPAPAIVIDQWVTGDAVEEFEADQIYVVEFWATWCGPCLSSMPHIAQLQTEYGDDVQFIGITDEDLATVTGFLEGEQSEGKLWSEVITYRLAIDDDYATNAAYMQAAGQNGIPTAFIVGKDGAIEWIGHPMTMDDSLASIVEGNWDRAAAIAEFEKQKRIEEAYAQLTVLYAEQKYDEALAMLDTLESEMGESTQTSRIRLFLLQAAGKTEEAAALQAQMVEDAWEDAAALNEIAWGIATGGGEDPDLALAQRAAERAVELSNSEDANIIDTLARVYFEQGDLERAIELETQAVELNPAFQTTLEGYLEAQAGTEEGEEGSDENP